MTGLLPPYAEVVRFDAGLPLGGGQLRDAARGDLPRACSPYVPPTNPFTRFGESLADKLPELLGGGRRGLPRVRLRDGAPGRRVLCQLRHLPPMALRGPGEPATARHSRAIVADSKVLSFKLARRRPFEVEPACAKLAADWDEAMSGIAALCALSMAEQLQSWRVATTAAGAFSAEPPGPDELEWRSETLPVQGSDDEDHWFRHTFDAAGLAPTLRFDGLATVCDVFLDGAARAAERIDVPRACVARRRQGGTSS